MNFYFSSGLAGYIPSDKVSDFQTKLITWFHKNHRVFPWRDSKDPFQILIAELLLQKTNSRVVPEVFLKFIDVFPNIESVNAASEDKIFEVISPLGLHYRAKRIKAICTQLSSDHRGKVPRSRKQLLNLPGVGQYVAAAVQLFGFGEARALLDANVIRVLSRVFSISSERNRPHTDPRLWEAAQSLMPEEQARDYNLALLDLAALVCRPKPNCELCPLNSLCDYYQSR